MKDDLVLWLLPGYILLFFITRIRPARNQSGWDFVLRNGVVSFFCFILSHLTIDYLSFVPRFIFSHLPNLEIDKNSLYLSNAIVISLFLGLLTKFKLVQRAIWYFGNIDPLTAFVKKAIKEKAYIILTLKNNRVYVGVLKGLTDDIDESLKFVELRVELSGHRSKKFHQTFFDKTYRDFDIPPEEAVVLFPLKDIETLRKFSWDIHYKFVNAGLTVLGPENFFE